jgi:anti-sigma B factor antagonist
MQFSEERDGPVVVLTPTGEMDVTTLPAFEARLSQLMDEGVRAVLWDLAEVGLLPSTALGFLLQARRRLAAVGGVMGLARAKGVVRTTLKTMGVIDVFPVFATREDGVASLRATVES